MTKIQINRKKRKKIQTIDISLRLDFAFVRLTGLEPAQPKPPDPKSGASTNSATGA